MRSLRFFFLSGLLAACAGEPPSVTGVEPSQGQVGDTITLTGEHLDASGMVLKLGGKRLTDLKVVDPQHVQATVPEGVKSGPLSLGVTASDGSSRSLSKFFTLVEPPPADPCSSTLKRMTHIPPTGDVVKIDTFKPGQGTESADVDRQQFSTRDIKQIEYEARLRDDSSYCTTIWLRTRDDRQILFDASTELVLRKQAQKIANGLSKPLEVIHEDEAPKPKE